MLRRQLRLLDHKRGAQLDFAVLIAAESMKQQVRRSWTCAIFELRSSVRSLVARGDLFELDHRFHELIGSGQRRS
jgi:hypothetical protein